MKKFYFALMALLGLNTCAFADNWMSHLPDETYVEAVSIPGTHDSGTGNGFDGFLGETFARTQDISFGDQWKIGIRAFDLRPCTTKDGYLNINHGIVATKLRFDDALYQLRDSLIANPSEFVVIHLLHEDSGDSGDTPYETMLMELLQRDDLKDFFVDFRKDLKVSDMRGKMLILSRDKYASKPVGGFMSNWCGYIDWNQQTRGVITGAGTGAYSTGALYMQDFSDTHEEGAVDVKIGGIQKLLDYTTTHIPTSPVQIVWAYNFASAYCNGSISTSDGYRENASYTHAAILDYLKTHQAGPTGIILMDYVGVDESKGYATRGAELVDSIIANNFKYLEYETEESRINKAVYADLSKILKTLNREYSSASRKINSQCPDVAADYTDELESIKACLDSIDAEVDSLYEHVLLTEDYTIDSEGLSAQISALVDEALKAQAEFEATGIYGIADEEENGACTYYSVSGERLVAPREGQITIVKYSNGKVKKIITPRKGK